MRVLRSHTHPNEPARTEVSQDAGHRSPRSGTAEARYEIHDLLVVLTRALDRLDRELIGSAFHFEATLHGPPVDSSGSTEPIGLATRQHIVEWLCAQLGAYAGTTHLLHESQIDVRTDRATAETPVIAHHLSTPDARFRATDTVVGMRWVDQLMKQGERWVILSRTVEMDWRYDLPVDNATVLDQRSAPDPVAFLPGRSPKG